MYYGYLPIFIIMKLLLLIMSINIDASREYQDAIWQYISNVPIRTFWKKSPRQ